MPHLHAVPPTNDPALAAYAHRMLAGWRTQMISANCTLAWVEDAIHHVEAFGAFAGGYPWTWRQHDVERWSATLLETNASSTVRGRQGALRQFFTFLLHPGYDWVTECLERFDVRLRQIVIPENSIPHASAYEGDPSRRNLTIPELYTLFAYLRRRLNECAQSVQKGWLTLARDYACIATVLGWGLRADETGMLDLEDLVSSLDARAVERYGTYGAVVVRYGKAKRRGPKRYRTVYTIPEFSALADTLRWYVDAIRPRFDTHGLRRLFVTERNAPLTATYISQRFHLYRIEAGLPDGLTLHSLRHSYRTLLGQWGYPDHFVAAQLGHESLSAGEGYRHHDPDFMRATLHDAVTRWEAQC